MSPWRACDNRAHAPQCSSVFSTHPCTQNKSSKVVDTSFLGETEVFKRISAGASDTCEGKV